MIGEADEPDSFQQPTLSPDGSTIVYWNWEAGVGARTTSTRRISPPARLARCSRSGLSRQRDRAALLPGRQVAAFDTAAKPGTGDAQLLIAPLDGHEAGRRIGDPYTYKEWDDIWWDFSPDGTVVLLNWSGADTQAEMNVTGRNDLIDSATGMATRADEWMFGPSWQRLGPDQWKASRPGRPSDKVTLPATGQARWPGRAAP